MTEKLEIITKANEEHGLGSLESLYSKGIIPREKKPYIINYKKSVGPYMALDKKDGHSYLLDTSSQIASLSLGFNPTALFGVAHHYEAWTNEKDSENSREIIKAFEDFLKRKCGHQCLEVSYTNSGSESNETALIMAYKRRKFTKARKVLAFEGSFHGRMLTSLFSTWNKKKREPFQIPGFETVFCSFPQMLRTKNDFEATKKQLELFENSNHRDFLDLLNKEIDKANLDKENQLYHQELISLKEVYTEIQKEKIFSIIIEPMQCEGGDKYGSSRFYNLLTILAKSQGIEIIYDEVQTGFHLGRDFFWFKSFNMKDSEGQEVFPDYLTSAKKSQTGFVLAFNGEKSINSEINYTSILRGFYQGLITDQQKEKILNLENMVVENLLKLNKKYKEFSYPRARGLAFSIDCENNEQVMSFIKNRFSLGLLIYPAGDKTLRFRINTAFKKEEIEYLFNALDKLAAHIFNGEELSIDKFFSPSKINSVDDMYKWHEKIVLAKKNGIKEEDALAFASDFFKDQSIEFKVINSDNFKEYKEDIIQIENDTYEPLRRTSIEKFERVVGTKAYVAIGLVKDKKLIGISFSGELRSFADERAMRRVKYFEHPGALYMLDTTVIKEYQEQGLGRYLKYSLELIAISKGLDYIYGRNRDVLAGSMLNTNISLGAIPELYASEDYLDDLDYRDVYIYRSNLKWPSLDEKLKMKLSRSPYSPLAKSEIDDDFIKENMPSLINKVCLSNFISNNYINQTNKLVQTLPKDLRYIFSSSGHSECMDKVYKSIYYKNQSTSNKPTKVLTFEGHHFGKNSMLAHSLSFPENSHYPVKAINDLSLKKFEEELNSGEYLCVYLDIETLIDEHNSKKIDLTSFLKNVKELCTKSNVSLVYDETVNHYGLDKEWLSSNPELLPDAMIIYLGGQMGICAMKEELRISDPLMMISTWDGDEYSLVSSVHALESDPTKLNENHKLNDIEYLGDNLILVGENIPYRLKKLFSGPGRYSLSNGEINLLNEHLKELS